MRRGIEDGTLRGDLGVQELVSLFGCLLESALLLTAEHRADVDQAAATVISVFLHGTSHR
jgi:hypothetical protein